MGNSEVIKQLNLLDILKIIRTRGRVTKPEIAKLTDLTGVTVHNYITTLVDRNVLMEDGITDSTGGRKAVIYRINPDFGYIVGQNVGLDYLRTSIFDINLKEIYSNYVTGNMEYNSKIPNLMCEEIIKGINRLNFKTDNCLGIGVSVPGQVDYKSGVVVNITNIEGWNNVPIKNILENNIHVQTFVDNDNNASVLSVKWLNIVAESSDTVYIAFLYGVGMGILINGKLFYGSHTTIGEIGHTTIQLDGPMCNCGNRGCIETLTSDYAIIEKVKKLKNNLPGLYNSNYSINEKMDISMIIKMAKDGDEDVYNILKQTAEYISITLDHIVKLYGPDVIIVDSNWINEFRDLYDYICDSVFSRCKWVRRDNLRIISNTVDNLESCGAAALVLENIFQYTNESSLLKLIKK